LGRWGMETLCVRTRTLKGLECVESGSVEGIRRESRENMRVVELWLKVVVVVDAVLE